ncbi:MAG: NAD(P)-dependent oxidoreductase [Desulfovibrio sp.]|mgnify:CR=1 FL=1|nr:MAG: NAD(P)-dependent oxidoreductase [Desulfovibrio sp.]
MRIAFLGMGIMGVPMTLNLLRAGFQVTVWNRNPDKCAPVVDAGASQAETPAEAAGASEVTILMLTGPEACNNALFGQDGASSALASGKAVVNMSTVPPAYSRELAQRIAELNADFVDAPVAGSKVPAEQGALLILAGGDPAEIERLTPVFNAMGKRTIHCGEAGAGSAMKMANNLLLAVMMAGYSEAVGLGIKGGVDMETLLDVLRSGPMGCGLFSLKEDMFRQGEFPPQFPAKHMAKDLRFAMASARETFAQTPVGDKVLALFETVLEQGLGEEDFAVVAKMLG